MINSSRVAVVTNVCYSDNLETFWARITITNLHDKHAALFSSCMWLYNDVVCRSTTNDEENIMRLNDNNNTRWLADQKYCIENEPYYALDAVWNTGIDSSENCYRKQLSYL